MLSTAKRNDSLYVEARLACGKEAPADHRAGTCSFQAATTLGKTIHHRPGGAENHLRKAPGLHSALQQARSAAQIPERVSEYEHFRSLVGSFTQLVLEWQAMTTRSAVPLNDARVLWLMGVVLVAIHAPI